MRHARAWLIAFVVLWFGWILLAGEWNQEAERFRDRAAYADRVLHEQPVPRAEHRLPFAVAHSATTSILYGLGATLVALATVVLGLWRNRLPEGWRRALWRAADPPLAALKAAHSGVIGDYIVYITVGTALIGGVWAFTLR